MNIYEDSIINVNKSIHRNVHAFFLIMILSPGIRNTVIIIIKASPSSTKYYC